jgi:hypothetical protein
MSKDTEHGLSTADFARAGEPRPEPAMHEPAAHDAQPALQQRGQPLPQDGLQPQREPLAALFSPDAAQDFRSRWDAVQIGFVDDPGRAVAQADELVAQVMKSLAESFAGQRADMEASLGQGGQGSTESQRLALQRYRSFFQRLLSL